MLEAIFVVMMALQKREATCDCPGEKIERLGTNGIGLTQFF
jgi:hypothetical protein